MAERLQVFKCNVCGHMIEVAHSGMGELTCCNQAMAHLVENTTDAAQEKHVPVIEKQGGGVLVKVGSVEHPMKDDHYIEWIQLLVDGKAYRQFLNPGDKPEAFFNVDGKDLVAREHCNLHGLWKG